MSYSEHWSTRGMSDAEVRIKYARIMSRACESMPQAVEEIELNIQDARDAGLIPDEGDRRTHA